MWRLRIVESSLENKVLLFELLLFTSDGLYMGLKDGLGVSKS